jgi:hypothetical protein
VYLFSERQITQPKAKWRKLDLNLGFFMVPSVKSMGRHRPKFGGSACHRLQCHWNAHWLKKDPRVFRLLEWYTEDEMALHHLGNNL